MKTTIEEPVAVKKVAAKKTTTIVKEEKGTVKKTVKATKVSVEDSVEVAVKKPRVKKVAVEEVVVVEKPTSKSKVAKAIKADAEEIVVVAAKHKAVKTVPVVVEDAEEQLVCVAFDDLTPVHMNEIKVMLGMANIMTKRLPNREDVEQCFANAGLYEPMVFDENAFIQITCTKSTKVQVFTKPDFELRREEFADWNISEYKNLKAANNAFREVRSFNDMLLLKILAVAKSILAIDTADSKMLFFIYSEESKRSRFSKKYELKTERILKRFLNYKYFAFHYNA